MNTRSNSKDALASEEIPTVEEAPTIPFIRKTITRFISWIARRVPRNVMLRVACEQIDVSIWIKGPLGMTDASPFINSRGVSESNE
jgi:hypothetical protein